MYGIAALFSRQRRISSEVLKQGTKSLYHRGADGRRTLKNLDVTDNGAFGYDSHGWTLQNLGTTNIRHTWVVIGGSRPPDPCSAFSGKGRPSPAQCRRLHTKCPRHDLPKGGSLTGKPGYGGM
jgi:hypothetical protein